MRRGRQASLFHLLEVVGKEHRRHSPICMVLGLRAIMSPALGDPAARSDADTDTPVMS